MVKFLFGFIVFFIMFSLLNFSYFSAATRFTALKALILDIITRLVSSKVSKFLFIFLFITFILMNLLGNVPFNVIPTMFYRFTLTISLLFWLSLIACVSVTQIKEFLAHTLPYGAPVSLILFLPLVEIFSQLIRPFTLMIRLSTNLSSGHIIMYIFSYFTLLSATLSPFIYTVIVLLFALELCISLLQAYIFVSLLSIYVRETA